MQNEKGITLIELLITVIIIGLFIAGSISLKQIVKNIIIKNDDLIIACNLAQDLREEILSKKYSKVNNIAIYNNNRTDFQKIMDYNGYTDNPPLWITGVPMNEYKDFKRKVIIKYIKPDENNKIIYTRFSDYLEIVISVYKNNFLLIELPFIAVEE